MYFALAFTIFVVTTNWVFTEHIEVLECEPPDFPEFGSYGPIQEFYTPGDTIHYYCNTSTYIGGNYLRLCLDSGDWTGDTPVCDPPLDFEDVQQTSTAEPSYKNDALSASDGSKTTCSATVAGSHQEWTAKFRTTSSVMRFMLFLPKGDVAYETFIIKPDGTEVSCGGNTKKIERLEWAFHNCLEPHNTGVASIKIKSTSPDIPLRLCEVVTHGLSDPTCTDPHVFVESGRMMVSRKKATLVCDGGFTKSRDSSIRCIRTGVWQRKLLFCTPSGIEVENIAFDNPARPQRERDRQC